MYRNFKNSNHDNDLDHETNNTSNLTTPVSNDFNSYPITPDNNNNNNVYNYPISTNLNNQNFNN